MSALAAVLEARMLVAALAGSLPTPSPVAVVVDATVIDGDALAARLTAGAEPLALQWPGARWPSVSIVVTGELLDFGVELTLAEAAGWAAPPSSSSRCPCTHAELVAHVQRRLAEALVAPPACAARPAAIARTAPVPPSPTQARRLGLGAMGRLGVVLVGLGGLGLGAGAGAWVAMAVARDEKFMPRTDLRPFSVAALAAGGGVLASAAVLLVLDRRLRRWRPRAH